RGCVALARREEGTQRLRVQGRVAPVAGLAALGRREDAGVVVVADRLCGQPMFSGKVDWSQLAPPIEASRYRIQVAAAEVSIDSSTITSRAVPAGRGVH